MESSEIWIHWLMQGYQPRKSTLDLVYWTESIQFEDGNSPSLNMHVVLIPPSNVELSLNKQDRRPLLENASGSLLQHVPFALIWMQATPFSNSLVILTECRFSICHLQYRYWINISMLMEIISITVKDVLYLRCKYLRRAIPLCLNHTSISYNMRPLVHALYSILTRYLVYLSS